MATLDNAPLPTDGATHTLADGVVLEAVDAGGGNFVWRIRAAVTGGTTISTGNGLLGTGSSTNPARLDPAVRNDLLLVNGFFLTSGTTVGTRTPYTGQIAGFPSATYWFDTADSAWHDAQSGGNRLIGF